MKHYKTKQTIKNPAELARNYYYRVVKDNITFFEAGSSFMADDLCHMVGLQEPTTTDYKTLHRFNMNKIAVQLGLNQILAAHGLVLKSSDYYSEYTVTTKQSSDRTVKNYKTKSKIKTAQARRLQNGIANYNCDITKLDQTAVKEAARQFAMDMQF